MMIGHYTLTATIPPMRRGCPIGFMDAPDGGYHPADSLACLCSRWVDPLLRGEAATMAVANGVPNQKWQTLCQNGRPRGRSAKMAVIANPVPKLLPNWHSKYHAKKNNFSPNFFLLTTPITYCRIAT